MTENTSDIDYISLNGKTQAQKKYCPANFSKLSSIIDDVPSTIKPWETVTLIKSQNLINSEWRTSWDKAIKYWKKTLKWKIRAIKDQWKSPKNTEKDIAINIQ